MMGSKCLIRQTSRDSFETLVVQNEVLCLEILPELGGKIVSLIRLESGHEYFLQPPEPERAYRSRSYGDSFEVYETSGFDECVPTIAACRYPEAPFLGSQLPDHGDVWCLPSAIEVIEERIRLTTNLGSLPIRFNKTVQLRANTVRLEYQATNLSSSTLKFLWSAHPLLRIETGAEIVLPKEVKELALGWSAHERLGKSGDRCTWPNASDRSGRIVRLDRIDSPSAGTADKLFTPRLSEGFCSMFLPRGEERITFRFDPQLVPYIGIWVCLGGWPTSREPKHFTAALEPCIGRPDSLEEAIERKECAVLPPTQSMQWWMEIEASGGAPRISLD